MYANGQPVQFSENKFGHSPAIWATKFMKEAIFKLYLIIRRLSAIWFAEILKPTKNIMNAQITLKSNTPEKFLAMIFKKKDTETKGTTSNYHD